MLPLYSNPIKDATGFAAELHRLTISATFLQRVGNGFLLLQLWGEWYFFPDACALIHQEVDR